MDDLEAAVRKAIEDNITAINAALEAIDQYQWKLTVLGVSLPQTDPLEQMWQLESDKGQ